MSYVVQVEPINRPQTDYIWQDREIRFDSKPVLLGNRKGERVIGKLHMTCSSLLLFNSVTL